MEELKDLVVQAQAGNLRAYDGLVRRFRDMALAYAHSLLGDFHLAEDAVQEAFVAAYEELGQLRAPEAFAAWFKRIVFAHCTRQMRRRKSTRLRLGHWTIPWNWFRICPIRLGI